MSEIDVDELEMTDWSADDCTVQKGGTCPPAKDCNDGCDYWFVWKLRDSANTAISLIN